MANDERCRHCKWWNYGTCYAMPPVTRFDLKAGTVNTRPHPDADDKACSLFKREGAYHA